ncbi:MAG: matrixin family metalloprotease [Terriglobales bacterium]
MKTTSKTSKWIAVASSVILSAVGLVMVVPAHSYLPIGIGSGTTFTNSIWVQTPSWVINPMVAGANIAGTSTDVTNVMQSSFATWMGAPDTRVAATFAGTSTATGPSTTENLVCFVCTGVDFSQDGTLAITLIMFDGSGNIINANIMFNPNATTGGSPTQPICFTTGDSNTTCPTNGSIQQDMRTVATHEVGHFFGLDHSAVVSAIMFPFAPPLLQTLSYDDVAAISLLYPDPNPAVPTGSISGRVTLNSTGVFGAHVFADSTTTANPFSAFALIRKTPIGTLTFPDGSYLITGVPPDTYVVTAEPLDGPVNDPNVSWAAEWQQPSVQTNFTTRWH